MDFDLARPSTILSFIVMVKSPSALLTLYMRRIMVKSVNVNQKTFYNKYGTHNSIIFLLG